MDHEVLEAGIFRRDRLDAVDDLGVPQNQAFPRLMQARAILRAAEPVKAEVTEKLGGTDCVRWAKSAFAILPT